MNRLVISSVRGVISLVACIVLAAPESAAAQAVSAPSGRVPSAPRRDTVVAVRPLVVTTPPPSSVRPTTIRSNVRDATAAGPVAIVSPSVAPDVVRQSAPTVVAGPPTPEPLVRPVPSRIAAAAMTPAQRIASADASPPSGATMRCKDGTFLTGSPSEERCEANGGLTVIFPALPPAPQPPARRP